MAFLFMTCLAGFISASAADTIMRQESHQNTMRKYKHRSEAQLTAAGEIDMSDQEKDQPALTTLTETSCNRQFLLGTQGSNDCTLIETHPHVVYDRAMCVTAAALAGVRVDAHHFDVRYDHYKEHPKGCFKAECTDVSHLTNASTGECYFFNSVDHKPMDNFTGQPVCARRAFILGDVDTNSCPTGSHIVTNELSCRGHATCMDKAGAENGMFRPSVDANNASMYEIYPKGCFISGATDMFGLLHEEVYFNLRDDIDHEPKFPKGTPLCEEDPPIASR